MLKDIVFTDQFIGRYTRLVKEVVLPYQERALNDMIEGAEKSHCIENFRLAAKKLNTGKCDEEFYGMVFQDSDVAKWLEGCAYSLALYPDSELEKRCDETIEIIASAQHPDGYLNTYFTVKAPDKRWTNLCEAHELYCAGHLIEAAVAYAECTGKTRFLEVMEKCVDNIYEHFITERSGGWSGHPEIELALMRLYNYTKNEKHLELAKYFVDIRGTSDFFINEYHKRDWSPWGEKSWPSPEYTQSQAPVREQTEATGHAVRAVYLYTGMAMLAKTTEDKELSLACERLWQDIVQKKMYVTGGIGSVYEGEAFSKEYHLPNDTAYAETCAAIGLIFFAKSMLALSPKSEYADIMERALYNGVLSGMQLDGTKFFYVNPLEVLPGISGNTPAHRHALPQRPKWFACACCPPNVARLLSSIGDYAYSIEENTLYCHLFMGSEIQMQSGKVICKTGYPYENEVLYTFAPDAQKMAITLALRLPAYSENTEILVNGKKAECIIKNGYAYIEGEFSADDEIKMTLDMSPKKIYANSLVSADSGKVAVLRGPLVYCAEGADNNGDVLSLWVSENTDFSEEKSDILGGIVKLYARGIRAKKDTSLYSFKKPGYSEEKLTLIPYYSWGNRGLHQMRVWLTEK